MDNSVHIVDHGELDVRSI